MKKLISIFACVLVLAMCFTACAPAVETENISLVRGGVLHLTVNPEIAISFDDNGNVTKVEARNDDGSKILADYTGFEGKACKTVVTELVAQIGEAGYFVEDVDGERRQIVLEIEPGSKVPSETFLNEIAEEVRASVDRNQWAAPVELKNENTRTCTNPYCDDADCDDLICDDGICTNPYCDETDCDDADCDDNIPVQNIDNVTATGTNKTATTRTCTNPYCDESDCDDADCDDNIPDREALHSCTNPYCTDSDCDDINCDEDAQDYYEELREEKYDDDDDRDDDDRDDDDRDDDDRDDDDRDDDDEDDD